MIRCLFVDEDDRLAQELCDFLNRFQIRATSTSTAGEARRLIGNDAFDLVVVAEMRNGETTLGLCRWIADHDGPPVIVIGTQDDSLDAIVALELGADDVVARPFEPRELVARIHAVARRCARKRGAREPWADRVYRFGGWQLDRVARRLTSPDGTSVGLTGSEFRLMLAFAENAGRLLTRDQLLDHAKGVGVDVSDRSIDLGVSRIRTKIAAFEGGTTLIRTVRGEGYLLDASTKD